MAPKSDVLIDDRVSLKQCKKAVNALHSHALKHQAQREETELLGGKEQHVWLQLTVKKMHPERKLKPHKIPIKHPIVDPRTTPVCLITKDPQREYKDLLESHNIKFISRVVGIAKLKGKFKPFEARRLLLQENGLFLADERVVPLLPGLLGKKFFEAKKQPIPVSLTRKDLKGELERAISSTYMHQNQGTCTSIKIGTLSQTPAQILANLQTALPAIVKAIKGSWDNVQSLNIKTNSSTALPIWSCDLGDGEGARWDGLQAQNSESEDSNSEDPIEVPEDELRELKKDAAIAGVKQGRKRGAEEAGEAKEKPKKKAKASKDGEGVTTKRVKEVSEKSSDRRTKSRKKIADEADVSSTELASTSVTALSSVSDSTFKAKKSTSKPKNIGNVKTSSSSPSVPVQLDLASGSEADVESSDPTLVDAAPFKERKKARKSTDVSNGDAPPAPSAPISAASSANSAQGPKKSKKGKTGRSPAAPTDENPSSLTPAELKTKRTLIGEKKKEKVLKGKKAGAKEAIVGKLR